MGVAKTSRLLVFSVITVVLVFSALEGLARLAGEPVLSQGTPNIFGSGLPRHYARDPRLGWRQRPNVHVDDPVYEAWARAWDLPVEAERAFVTNSRGFRDSEPADPKPEGQLRYLVLGDSSVFGVGAPRESTFSERLERALNNPWEPDAAQRSVEIFNTGVSGYSSFQSIIVLEESLDLGLDGVLVYSQNSDIMDAVGPTDSEVYLGLNASLMGHPFKHLALYRWLAHGVSRARATGQLGEMKRRVPVVDYRANLHHIIEMGAEQGFDVMFIQPPVTSDLMEPEPPESYGVSSESAARRAEVELERISVANGWWLEKREHYRMAMALEAYRAGIPVVDGPRAVSEAWLSDFTRYDGATAIFVDELHPSAEGHRIIAEAALPPLRALVDRRTRRP